MSSESFIPPETTVATEGDQSAYSLQLLRRVSAVGMGGFVVMAGPIPGAMANTAPAAQVNEASPQHVVDLAVPVGPPIPAASSPRLGELTVSRSPRVDNPDLNGVKYGPIETLVKPSAKQSAEQQRLFNPDTLRIEVGIADKPQQLSLNFIGASLRSLAPPKPIKEIVPIVTKTAGATEPDVVAPEPPKPAPVAASTRRLASELTPSEEGIDLIARWEGWSPVLYNDAAGHATIGYGHLVHYGPVNGSESSEFRNGITEERGRELLRHDLASAEQAVDEAVKVPITQVGEDVLNSLTFNIGNGALKSSTLVKRLNQGEYDAVDDEIMRWNMAGGREIAGLTNRRTEEARRWNESLNGGASASSASETPASPAPLLSTVELAPSSPITSIGASINKLLPPPKISNVIEMMRPSKLNDGVSQNRSEERTRPYFQKPFNGPAIVTSEFGHRDAPTEGASSCHLGLDFAMDIGDPVLAPRDGRVVANATLPGHGNMLGIMHDGVVTWYSHLHERSPLAVGTKVKTGQTVAKAGTSGTSTGPHLHFGVQVGVDPTRDVSLQDNVNGHYVDPSGFLDGSIRSNNQFNTLPTAIAC